LRQILEMSVERFLNLSVSIALVATVICAPLVDASARPVGAVRPARENFEFEQRLELRAYSSINGVLVEWSTSFDTATLGFNVYRIRNGSRKQLNPGLIAGGVLITRRAQSYSWFDSGGTSDCVYEVEAIDLKGEPSAIDSVTPEMSQSPVANRQSALLDRLGLSSGTTEPVMGADAVEGKSLSTSTTEAVPPAPLPAQWAIANLPALKIGVRSNGWYHITQSEMAAAGFDTSGDAANLQLFVSANEIAMRVSRASGPLTSSDFIEFWGEGLDTATTDTQVYWLINGAQPGKRIATKAELQPSTIPETSPTPPATRIVSSPVFWFPEVRTLIAPGLVEAKADRSKVSEQGARGPNVESPIRSDESFDKPISQNQPALRNEKKTKSTNAASSVNRNLMDSPSVANRPTSNTALDKKVLMSRKPSPARLVRRKNSRRRARNLRRHNHVLAIAPAPAFTYSVQRKDRTVYYSAALNGDQENYFGAVVFGDGPLITLTTHNIESTSTAPAQLQVALQGVSVEAHQVKVFINGSLAGTVLFADQNAVNQTLSIPTSWLVEGDNVVKLAPVGSSHDTSVVDYLRITYPHSFRVDNDALQFSLRSIQSARIEGFSTASIRALDVSDPSNVLEIDPIVESSGGGFAATIPGLGRGKARRLMLLPANRFSQPAWLTLNQPSTLNRATNAGDFLIIAHKNFMPALAPLVAQRQAQGFTVMVVDVENVFDEFSYGRHTPQALRDFLSLARTTWSRSPAYLLLVGDASYDARNYSGAGNFDFVPSKEIDTGEPASATALETASDDWLTDFNGDGIADIPTGRLPVRTIAEANLFISKIVNYAPANTPQSALLVADAQGTYYFNFEAADDQVGATLPASMAVQKVYRRLQPSDADARNNIIANFNSGQAVTVYSGHGNVNIWGGSIFTSNDASALTNGSRLPFVVVMDCLNGYFADPSLQSLAESLVKAPNGGAVASFASSGLTIPDGQHEMGLKMFQLLYGGSSIAIGEASRQAKFATNDKDVRRTWILFGDPSIKIR
jgi:hypothetical protein